MLRSRTITCVIALAALGFASIEPARATGESEHDPLGEALNLGMLAKLAVSETWMERSEWPESNAAAGLDLPPDAIADVVVGKNGVVTVTFNRPANLAGSSIILTPRADEERTVHWSCESQDIATEKLPQDCP